MTEEEIVYEILNTVYGGQITSDAEISERLVRSYLQKHRSSKMYKFFNRGQTVSDDVFQNIGSIPLEKIASYEFDYMGKIPKIVRFDNNEGIRISKLGYNIPTLDSEAFRLSKNNFMNKTTPKAKVVRNTLTVFSGNSNLCLFSENSLKEKVVELFGFEAEEIDDVATIYVDVEAVLFDPEDGLDYDWTVDPYPCPSEVVDEILTSTYARDLNLMLKVEQDQVQNNRTDNIASKDG